MGPETTAERVCEDLMQAVTCLKRVMVGMKNCGDAMEIADEQSPNDSNTVICTLIKITGTLERCMESNKQLNEVLNGKMKCTTCGATSVGLLSDCHDSATSTTTTVSHRSSAEPPRRKTSENEQDEEIECSSIESRSIGSVSSSVNAEEDDSNQTILAPNGMEFKSPKEEEEEHDLVMKTILSTTTSTSTEDVTTPPPLAIKSEENVLQDIVLWDQFLQSSLLGFTPNMMKTIGGTTTPASEENDEDKYQNAVLNNFFQILLANQQAGNAGSLPEASASENGTDSTSSQASPPADGITLDSMIESLLAESMGQGGVDGASSAEGKPTSRKRKSTPMKVPKSENGAGYICPMDGCNKVFKEKGSVHRHFVTHIGMRFNCDKCKASYTQKHALMLHQKIHLNPDAYQCRGCGTNYTTQNGLRLHRQRNPTCMEVANTMEFNNSLTGTITNSLSKNSTPTKQMVSAP